MPTVDSVSALPLNAWVAGGGSTLTEQNQRQVEPQAKRRLDLLDYLRFAAASMVVAFHYLVGSVNTNRLDVSPSGLAPIAKYGYLGVDLFFLISGFVIMESARGKTARQFAVARAKRLYPAYWAAVLITAAAIMIFGSHVGLSVSLGQVAANLSMMQGLAGIPPVDSVYWSLLFELEFYGMVFFLLLLRQGHRIGRLLPWWAILMLVVSIAAPGLETKPFLGGYFAYFATGALIAEVRRFGPSFARVVGLIAAAATVLAWAPKSAKLFAEATSVYLSPSVVIGVVALCMLLVAAMWLPLVAGRALPRAALLGALTYPLYLLHANFGYIVMDPWINDHNRLGVYALTYLLMLALAWAVHYGVERRRFWRPLFELTVGRIVGLADRPSRTETNPERVMP